MFFRSWLGNGNAIVPVFEPVRNYSSTLRWILEGEDMPGDVLVVILVFLQSLLNDWSWPLAAFDYRLFGDSFLFNPAHFHYPERARRIW